VLRPESWVIEERFELAPKTVSGDTTANGQRKGVPNSWSGNSEAARTETCADTGNERQFRVRQTQGTRLECNVSGMNRGRQAGYRSRYGFVGNADNLELDVTW